MKTNKIIRKGWVLKATDKEGKEFFFHKMTGAYDKYGVGEQDDDFNDIIPFLPIYATRKIANSWKRRFKEELVKEASTAILITKPIFPCKIESVPYNLTIG